MKNLAKLLVMALLVGLFGVVAISSLLATPSVQTPLVATTSYNEETGIRWNEGFGVFEVFNAAGISYIASGKLIDESGTLDSGEAATGDKTYHIMQDIAYEETHLEESFKLGTRYSIAEGGAVLGRGFLLKNFPLMTSEGTALFKKNEGTIQSITLVNPVHTEGTSGSVGIICYENKNIIDNCTVIGEGIDTNDALNIAAIAYKGSGTIRNCTNELSFKTMGTYAAGIIANANSTIIYDCRNAASIESMANNGVVGGIAGTIASGRVLNNSNYGDITAIDAGGLIGNCLDSEVKSNKNFGTITGTITACGIIGGTVVTIDEEDNFHYGSIVRVNGDGTASHDNYLPEGSIPVPIDTFGIKYDPNADVFLIENKIGLSYLGSEQRFNYLGGKVTEGTPFSAIASKTNTTYIITENIDYASVEDSSSDLFTNMPLVVGAGSVVDGGNKELTNFQIRQTIKNNNEYSALFESIGIGAEVRNIKLSLAVDPSKEDGSTFIPGTDAMGTIGILSHLNDGTIRNCETTGFIKTSLNRNIAGMAYSSSSISSAKYINCVNRINIIAKSAHVAGILCISSAGNTVEFEDCKNFGELTSLNRETNVIVGGIAALPNTIIMKNCTNSGNLSIEGALTTTDIFLGGLMGQMFSGYIYDSTNEAEITFDPASSTSNMAMGGLVGWVTHWIVAVDSSNAATAKLIAKGDTRQPMMGGLVGFTRSRGSSHGSIESSKIDVTINNSQSTVLLNCTNEGTLELRSSKSNPVRGIGGIVGEISFDASGLTATLVHCSNFGAMELEKYDSTTLESRTLYAGGIVGFIGGGDTIVNSVTFDSCTNTKDLSVSLRGSYLGGILGNATGSKLGLIATNNTFSGAITAPAESMYNTGVFAGRVANTSLTTLACSGGGTAPSNRYVGNIEATGPVIPVELQEPETQE